jgi:hypothetical protein
MLVMVSLLLMTSCSNDDDNTPPQAELPENMVDVGNYNLYSYPQTQSISVGVEIKL